MEQMAGSCIVAGAKVSAAQAKKHLIKEVTEILTDATEFGGYPLFTTEDIALVRLELRAMPIGQVKAIFNLVVFLSHCPESCYSQKVANPMVQMYMAVFGDEY